MTFFYYYSLLRDWPQIIYLNYVLSVSLISTYKQKAEYRRNYLEVLGQLMNS